MDLFLGMYVAFLIAYACFYIHAHNIDSHFGLSVGALFAVIGNKHVIDSSLPETTTFNLVETASDHACIYFNRDFRYGLFIAPGKEK
jgi:hypothetical protein